MKTNEALTMLYALQGYLENEDIRDILIAILEKLDELEEHGE